MTPPIRRWFTFSLRTLFVGATVIICWTAHPLLVIAVNTTNPIPVEPTDLRTDPPVNEKLAYVLAVLGAIKSYVWLYALAMLVAMVGTLLLVAMVRLRQAGEPKTEPPATNSHPPARAG